MSRAALLTKREAARLLGVDRKTTLENLIHDRMIRTVRWMSGVRIPRSEVERLAEEGLPPAGASATPVKRKRPNPQKEAQALRMLDVRTLKKPT